MRGSHVVIAGAGVFGAAAPVELLRRGAGVTVIDPGPLPHALAESTDISKAVRIEYGADEAYTAAMERALEGWHRWNADWQAPLFHATGMLWLSPREISAGGFEHACLTTLSRRGHTVERLDRAAIVSRFPAWSSDRFPCAFFNPRDGFAESGKVVEALLADASSLGARLVTGARVGAVREAGGRTLGATLEDGSEIDADWVVVAAGAWAADLVPSLAPMVRGVGQPVFHLAPPDPDLFRRERFPTFSADISATGWYGFPLHEGVVKIANHGVGRAMHPSSDARRVTDDERESLRAFVATALPSLASAPIVKERVCVYGDTPDEHFLIDRVPGRSGLVVATGGSGHAFKFAPLVGAWIADALEGAPPPLDGRFAWRAAASAGEEEARARTATK